MSILESGAILLHRGERSDALMFVERRRSEVTQGVFAALNSVEMASLPWSLFQFSGDTSESPGRKHLDAFLKAWLRHMDAVLAAREWLAGSFSVADILMADVRRPARRFERISNCVTARATLFQLSKLPRRQSQ